MPEMGSPRLAEPSLGDKDSVTAGEAERQRPRRSNPGRSVPEKVNRQRIYSEEKATGGSGSRLPGYSRRLGQGRNYASDPNRDLPGRVLRCTSPEQGQQP